MVAEVTMSFKSVRRDTTWGGGKTAARDRRSQVYMIIM